MHHNFLRTVIFSFTVHNGTAKLLVSEKADPCTLPLSILLVGQVWEADACSHASLMRLAEMLPTAGMLNSE